MRAMICNFPSVFANEYKRIKPEKCAVEYPPRAFRAFSRPFFFSIDRFGVDRR